MAGIRHYFAVICKAFDSIYKQCAGVFKSRHSRISSSSPAICYHKGTRWQCDGCHARHTIRYDGVSRIVWKWQGCTQRRFRCRGSSVMIVLAHGVLSSPFQISLYTHCSPPTATQSRVIHQGILRFVLAHERTIWCGVLHNQRALWDASPKIGISSERFGRLDELTRHRAITLYHLA